MSDERKAACVIGWPARHSRSPLIHQDDPEALGIEEAALVILAPAARASVHHQHRKPIGVSAFFYVQLVGRLDGQTVTGVGFNLRIEGEHGHQSNTVNVTPEFNRGRTTQGNAGGPAP